MGRENRLIYAHPEFCEVMILLFGDKGEKVKN